MGAFMGGHGTDGRLILADNRLAAVLICPDRTRHGLRHKGPRHLEAGFGKLNIQNEPLLRLP